jgi:hypothetical protein
MWRCSSISEGEHLAWALYSCGSWQRFWPLKYLNWNLGVSHFINVMTEAIRTSETSVFSNETKRRCIPEGSYLHSGLPEVCCNEGGKLYCLLPLPAFILRSAYWAVPPRSAAKNEGGYYSPLFRHPHVCKFFTTVRYGVRLGTTLVDILWAFQRLRPPLQATSSILNRNSWNSVVK